MYKGEPSTLHCSPCQFLICQLLSIENLKKGSMYTKALAMCRASRKAAPQRWPIENICKNEYRNFYTNNSQNLCFQLSIFKGFLIFF